MMVGKGTLAPNLFRFWEALENKERAMLLGLLGNDDDRMVFRVHQMTVCDSFRLQILERYQYGQDAFTTNTPIKLVKFLISHHNTPIDSTSTKSLSMPPPTSQANPNPNFAPPPQRQHALNPRHQ